MKRVMMAGWILCAGIYVDAGWAEEVRRLEPLDAYNVVWDSPSENAHGSMPLGNGEVGVNAWVEKNGDLVFYVSKTDAWDENGRLCKIGRVRVTFDPPLPVTDGFRQALILKDGCIEIRGRSSPADSGDAISLRLWVDAHKPTIHVEAESGAPVACRAEVELWRLRERPLGDDDDGHSARGLAASAFKPTVLPDVVVPSESSRVAWYHRNTRSVYGFGLQVQHLEALKDRFPDPLLNHTFGASLRGEGFVRDGERAIRSTGAGKRHRLSVCVLAMRAETLEAWLDALGRLERKASSSRASRRATVTWWKAFWARSWVFVNDREGPSALTRGYVLQRFMNACGGRGGAPIKFNGSIFTVENKPGASPETPEGDPDWRRWGGNYWFQNTRHSYWPMLAAGDFDLMAPWFRMYLNALPLSKARLNTYYGFNQTAQFPETMYFWGLPNNGDYGWGNKAPEPANTYIRRYWSGSLELTAVLLDYYDFTQDRAFARDTLLPLADPLIAFLDQYWTKRDAQGKIVFDPAQSLETYHVAVNPLPEIAGLYFLLPRLLTLPETLTTDAQRARWARMLGELPPVPMGEVDGAEVLRPAESFSAHHNVENPELYGIFPFRLYGVGRADLDLARRTYEKRRYRHNSCWCQDSIQAACLGLGEEAGRQVAQRAKQVNAAYRFPAMWGPYNDWIPDQDHGNPILTTLQTMLLQHDGDKIFLFPAWPKTWDVAFKLHAPKNTVVEGEVRGGKVTYLKVTPKSRAADVVNLLGAP